jgi:hypothetical protein
MNTTIIIIILIIVTMLILLGYFYFEKYSNKDVKELKYIVDDIDDAIKNNNKIEDKLHMIIVLSNASGFNSRFKLAHDFIDRISKNKDINLYIVELIYPGGKYSITENNKKNHLQLYAETPLWHKENLVNIGVRNLLPENWKAFCWCDADIEFDSPHWVDDTLKILNGTRDIIQNFSHCLDMDANKDVMKTYASSGFQYTKRRKFFLHGRNYMFDFHPGYCWSMTRSAYEKIGGIYEYAILGSGDSIMALSFIGNGILSLNEANTDEYKKSVKDFEKLSTNLKFGYCPGIIRHHFHGNKKNRQFATRWKILINHKFNPYTFLTKDCNGLLIPTEKFPEDLKKDIKKYFDDRKEDD